MNSMLFQTNDMREWMYSLLVKYGITHELLETENSSFMSDGVPYKLFKINVPWFVHYIDDYHLMKQDSFFTNTLINSFIYRTFVENLFKFVAQYKQIDHAIESTLSSLCHLGGLKAIYDFLPNNFKSI